MWVTGIYEFFYGDVCDGRSALSLVILICVQIELGWVGFRVMVPPGLVLV